MPELAVVVPVYNEEGVVAQVVGDWIHALDALGIDFELHAYDDGSHDASPKILSEIAQAEERLHVHAKANTGHGPTILAGYLENAEAEWIFQIDSDDEMGPGAFAELWNAREGFDLGVGERIGTSQPRTRQLVSAASRLAVRALYGEGVSDVNTPYRLMRTSALRPLFESLPRDTFAPNVIVSGVAATWGLRVHAVRVPHRPRTTGTVSIRRMKLLRAAVLSLIQTALARFRLPSQR